MKTSTSIKKSSAKKRPAKTGRSDLFLLRLYIAGHTPNSVAAIANLKKICEDNDPGARERRQGRALPYRWEGRRGHPGSHDEAHRGHCKRLIAYHALDGALERVCACRFRFLELSMMLQLAALAASATLRDEWFVITRAWPAEPSKSRAPIVISR